MYVLGYQIWSVVCGLYPYMYAGVYVVISFFELIYIRVYMYAIHALYFQYHTWYTVLVPASYGKI